MAAVLISLSVARQRGDLRRDDLGTTVGRTPAAAPLNLAAIREAGY